MNGGKSMGDRVPGIKTFRVKKDEPGKLYPGVWHSEAEDGITAPLEVGGHYNSRELFPDRDENELGYHAITTGHPIEHPKFQELIKEVKRLKSNAGIPHAYPFDVTNLINGDKYVHTLVEGDAGRATLEGDEDDDYEDEDILENMDIKDIIDEISLNDLSPEELQKVVLDNIEVDAYGEYLPETLEEAEDMWSTYGQEEMIEAYLRHTGMTYAQLRELYNERVDGTSINKGLSGGLK
jgi:hypothetical protein